MVGQQPLTEQVPGGTVRYGVRRHEGIEVSAEASDHGWFRRLRAEMHAEQARFLAEVGLAEPPPAAAESPHLAKLRTDGGD